MKTILFEMLKFKSLVYQMSIKLLSVINIVQLEVRAKSKYSQMKRKNKRRGHSVNTPVAGCSLSSLANGFHRKYELFQPVDCKLSFLALRHLPVPCYEDVVLRRVWKRPRQNAGVRERCVWKRPYCSQV